MVEGRCSGEGMATVWEGLLWSLALHMAMAHKSVRLAQDFRRLNEVIQPMKFPTRKIEEMVEEISNKKQEIQVHHRPRPSLHPDPSQDSRA